MAQLTRVQLEDIWRERLEKARDAYRSAAAQQAPHKPVAERQFVRILQIFTDFVATGKIPPAA